jgi:DNA adenine methylase
MQLDKAKPFLRWAGSKRKTIPELLHFWSTSKKEIYLEPFVGSGQLFFNINAKKAIISDVNEDLINTYRQIQSAPETLHLAISEFGPISQEKYYEIRALDHTLLNVIDRAARFIYLNRYCFNGLYRTNKQGKFNVPYANNNKTGALVTKEALQACSEKLKNTIIIEGDFEGIVRNYVDNNSFVYLDPPYAISNKRVFKQYDPASFGLDDISRLKKLLQYIDKRKGDFLLSYAYTKDTVEHFEKWSRKRIIAQRNIAGFAENRKKSAELIATNIHA